MESDLSKIVTVLELLAQMLLKHNDEIKRLNVEIKSLKKKRR